MEDVAALTILAAAIWWAYKNGKRTGSRKGYNVGRDRANRSHRNKSRRNRPHRNL